MPAGHRYLHLNFPGCVGQDRLGSCPVADIAAANGRGGALMPHRFSVISSSNAASGDVIVVTEGPRTSGTSTLRRWADPGALPPNSDEEVRRLPSQLDQQQNVRICHFPVVPRIAGRWVTPPRADRSRGDVWDWVSAKVALDCWGMRKWGSRIVPCLGYR